MISFSLNAHIFIWQSVRLILLSSEQDITADRVKCGAHLADHNTEYSRFGVNMILHIRDGKKVDGTNPYNLFDQLAASGENRFFMSDKKCIDAGFYGDKWNRW